MKKHEISEIIENIKSGTEEILVEKELTNLLKKKEKLVVKAGFDPSTAHMHLGHLVILNKLKAFQDYGHKIVFLVGNFTGMIGDPTCKETTRKMLSEKEVQRNAAFYNKQVFNILDPKKTIIKYNADWLKSLNLGDLLGLLSTHSVARMLEREDFKKRYKNKQKISIHEFIYPLLQGYDSVHLKSDIEIGGTDQKFNLLVGRELQKKYGQDPQIVITMPLLEGTDGKNKMSKSLNNSINMSDSPEDVFGKVMSISDELMWKYYHLVLCKSKYELTSLKLSNNTGKQIKFLKMRLAHSITEILHGKEKANMEEKKFDLIFKNRKIPNEIKTIEIKTNRIFAKLSWVIKESMICESQSIATRLIKQNAVKINNEKITDPNHEIKINSKILLQVGKRKFLKIKIKN